MIKDGLSKSITLSTDESVLNVLLACEESQAVTKELRLLGHNAFSCDLLEQSGGHPEWHIRGDVTELLKLKWDLIIAFPPCTFLTVTGNRWFNVEKYGDAAIKRQRDRLEAIEFFRLFTEQDTYLAIENPVGIMSSEFRKPDQIINPYQFGDPFEKRTCLWLKDLPPLRYTDEVTPPERLRYESGKSLPSWFAEAWKLPKAARSRVRSKTFPGIAKAMAKQWSDFILSERV